MKRHIKNQPVIVKEINPGHFIVIDNKLAITYSVKDPAWYNTKKLDESATNYSETALDYTAQYNLFFDPLSSNNTTIELFDETPPEAIISFDPITQKLTVQGADNTTVNPVVSLIGQNKETIYQIQDEAENTTKLVFGKVNQKGKEIKAELKAIQYNSEPIVELPKTELKYEWSLDKKTNQIKELEQRIKVKDTFDIKAKYNYQKADVFEAPEGVGGGDALNIEKGLVTRHPGYVWTGLDILTEEIKKEWREQGKKSTLYLYDLFTKEQTPLETTDEPLWFFKPKWISETELEYTLPSGEKKIYRIEK